MMCEEPCMKPKERTYEHVRIMEMELESAKKKWLVRYGWTESCSFVDAYWRWTKEIDGVPYMCDMGEAINIEYNCLDPEDRGIEI